MTQASTATTQEKESFNLVSWRKAKVLELHSQGLTEREMADKLKVSQSTVHRDIVTLREQAAEGLKDHIRNVPYVWIQSVTSIDLLIKRAFELFNGKNLEFDQNIELMKVISVLTTTRLNLHGEPQILDRAYGNITKLRSELECLKKEKPSCEAITEETQEGKKHRTGRKFSKIEKKKAITPVV